MYLFLFYLSKMCNPPPFAWPTDPETLIFVPREYPWIHVPVCDHHLFSDPGYPHIWGGNVGGVTGLGWLCSLCYELMTDACIQLILGDHHSMYSILAHSAVRHLPATFFYEGQDPRRVELGEARETDAY